MWMMPIFSGGIPSALGRIGPQDLGRDLPRRLDRQDLAAERGIAPLDDADDDGAGRGDEGPGPGMLVEVLLGRGAVELADRAEVVDLVEADPAQGGEDLGGQDGGAELAVEHRRGDGHLVFEGLQGGERRRMGVDGVVGADAEALAAVDAQLVDDAGLAVLDPDGLGRAGGQAVDAADALVLGDVDGVEVPVVFHGVTCPFVRMMMSRRVPRPTSESMAKTSAFLLMFGRPMPAPKPSSRISGRRRRIAFGHGQLDVGDAGAAVVDGEADLPGGDASGPSGASPGVHDDVHLRLVGDDGRPANGLGVEAEVLQELLDLAGDGAGLGEIPALDRELLPVDVLSVGHGLRPRRCRRSGRRLRTSASSWR